MLKTLIDPLELSENATEAQALEAVNKLITVSARVPQLETDLAAATTGNQTVLSNARLEATKASGQAQTFKTAFESERAARIKDHLDAAIVAGRIVASDRAMWETTLSNQQTFETKLEELDKHPPVVKTSSRTQDLSTREFANGNTPQARRAIFMGFVNKHQSEGMKYEDAYAAADREHPDFFPKPETE